MIDLLPWIGLLVAVALLSFIAIPRLAGYWYTRSAWTLSGADLASKFHGLILFGLDGSYLALSPKAQPDRVLFTKRTTEGGTVAFRVRISSGRLTSDRVDAIQARLDAQPNRIQWSLVDTDNSRLLEIEIGGPVVSDAAGMEGVASGVLATLGYDCSQKYRIAFEGPNDEERIAEYFGG